MTHVIVQQCGNGRVVMMKAEDMWNWNYLKMKLYCEQEGINRGTYRYIYAYQKQKYIRAANTRFKDRHNKVDRSVAPVTTSEEQRSGKWGEQNINAQDQRFQLVDRLTRKNHSDHDSGDEFDDLEDKIEDMEEGYWSNDGFPKPFSDPKKEILDRTKRELAELERRLRRNAIEHDVRQYEAEEFILQRTDERESIEQRGLAALGVARYPPPDMGRFAEEIDDVPPRRRTSKQKDKQVGTLKRTRWSKQIRGKEDEDGDKKRAAEEKKDGKSNRKHSK